MVAATFGQYLASKLGKPAEIKIKKLPWIYSAGVKSFIKLLKSSDTVAVIFASMKGKFIE